MEQFRVVTKTVSLVLRDSVDDPVSEIYYT